MRYLRILALIAAAAATNAAAEDGVVRMGTEGYYPPFEYFDSAGNLNGFDIDIGNALCDAMKVKCEWVSTDWDGIIPALNAKKFDAILSSMAITAERAKVISFTAPYYFNPDRFVASKDSGLKSALPADLKGLVVGTQSGTTEVAILKQYFPEVEVKLYPKLDDALLDLDNQRLDLVLASQFVLADWLAKDSGACCDFVGEAFGDDGMKGTGIAVRKDDEALLKRLNDALAEIQANGTYGKIRARYFKFDIMTQPKLAGEIFN